MKLRIYIVMILTAAIAGIVCGFMAHIHLLLAILSPFVAYIIGKVGGAIAKML